MADPQKSRITNGKEDIFTNECLPGFVPGRTKNRRMKNVGKKE